MQLNMQYAEDILIKNSTFKGIVSNKNLCLTLKYLKVSFLKILPE